MIQIVPTAPPHPRQNQFFDGCGRLVEILEKARRARDEDRLVPLEAEPARAEAARRRAADIRGELTR
jgi:hypothetical protein